jgi:hypothetical protein
MNRESPLRHAYYADSIQNFALATSQTILGHLAEHHAHELDPAQRMAWLSQIEILLREFQSSEGWIAFEFAIPRMGRRADVIVIFHGVIFVLEFKVGAKDFDRAAIDQAIDYCLDLKNFHAGSHDRALVPVVVATRASNRPGQLPIWPDDIAQPLLTNGMGLRRAMELEAGRFSGQPPCNPAAWMASGYKPTPTIIEAAQALYSSHRVEEITRSDAGAKNLTLTTQRLSAIIADAKQKRHKAICFVTGVPGAGKTLAGLNLAVQYANLQQSDRAVFLSGNDPLVEVLREALARDEARRLNEVGKKVKVEECRRKVKLFIQNIHHFRDANLTTHDPPIEKVAVFDEAQRAWDESHLSAFMARRKGIHDFSQSEPAFLIDVFNRHADWCVIVCLVGGGQEINAGEAGLPEWFAAIAAKHRDWKIYTSDQLEAPEYRWNKNLKAVLAGLNHQVERDLHLSVSVRSFRAEKLSMFVNALVSGDAASAAEFCSEIKSSYPIRMTRHLKEARRWLRMQARGSERYGLVAYSGASRLKPEGVNVHEKIDAPTWFLNGKPDVRASFYLEDPATEFDIQGLELDWVGICWDANFRREGDGWAHYAFRGSQWQSVRDEVRQSYLANAHRVLLTRGRQGIVIYVPEGDKEDWTRPPEVYDAIATYLESCGIEPLKDGDVARTLPRSQAPSARGGGISRSRASAQDITASSLRTIASGRHD